MVTSVMSSISHNSIDFISYGYLVSLTIFIFGPLFLLIHLFFLLVCPFSFHFRLFTKAFYIFCHTLLNSSLPFYFYIKTWLIPFLLFRIICLHFLISLIFITSLIIFVTLAYKLHTLNIYIHTSLTIYTLLSICVWI